MSGDTAPPSPILSSWLHPVHVLTVVGLKPSVVDMHSAHIFLGILTSCCPPTLIPSFYFSSLLHLPSLCNQTIRVNSTSLYHSAPLPHPPPVIADRRSVLPFCSHQSEHSQIITMPTPNWSHVSALCSSADLTCASLDFLCHIF